MIESLEEFPTQRENDLVNPPSDFSEIEWAQFIEQLNVDCAIKHLWDAGLKEKLSDIQDLEKAKWYIEREIQRRLKNR